MSVYLRPLGQSNPAQDFFQWLSAGAQAGQTFVSAMPGGTPPPKRNWFADNWIPLTAVALVVVVMTPAYANTVQRLVRGG